MKICVYGAGVIGGMLCGSLARAGHDVCAIARGPHLEAIRAKGLTIVNPNESVTHNIAASSSPADFGPQDLVIVATKTPALSEVAASIAPLLGPKTMVGFAVNGVFWFYGDGFQPNGIRLDISRLDPGGLLHKEIGVERSLGFVCWSGGEVREPGIVQASRAGGRVAIGPALPSNAALSRKLVADMNVTDVTVESADDIRATMWEKCISVVGNFAICTLTGGSIGEVSADKATQDVLLAVQSEADAIAHAHGFENTGFDVEKLRANPHSTAHKPSMLQDLERGRRMEIESSHLIIQDLARQTGVKTPALDLVVPLLVARARNAGCY